MAVLEIGTNHPGEIAWLTKAAEPTHVLITNIGREHLEFFGDIKGVAQEERAAFDILNEHGGFAFINYDDKYLKSAKKQFAERCMTYGVDQPEADVSAMRLGFTKDGRIELRVAAEGKSFKLRTHVIADYAPNMIAGAVAIGLHFKMRRAEIKAAIEHFRPHDKRLEIIRTFMGPTIFNDTYNANPDSVEAACRTLAQFPASGKKYAVLGDMFELGATSQKEHRALGKRIAEFNFEKVFFTGRDMETAWKSYLNALGLTNGKSLERAEYSPNKEALAETLRSKLQEGDAVLVKGSRGMKMEDVVDMLQRP
jgi:UDP-N-acetylmuramyl pentapeptide synthase